MLEALWAASIIVLLINAATSRAGRLRTTAPTHSDHPLAPAEMVADQNRIFLLVANVYPAILGTMIWALMDDRPRRIVTWLATFLIVVHFSLDLLYLKTNLDAPVKANLLRYGWTLFLLDIVLVILMRAAFATVQTLEPEHRSEYLTPISYFTLMYALYVVWELAYLRENRTIKATPLSSVIHYGVLAGWFAACFGLRVAYADVSPPDWREHLAVAGFLLGLTAACAELYWSLFLADRADTGTG